MSDLSSQLPAADLIEALMKDPAKRILLLQLLTKEKDNLENYRRKELKTKTTPLKKAKKLHCESPTALHRRRALLQKPSSESSSSEFSEVATEINGPKLPFEELLKGVRAYVEVKRDNVDRSDGIKAVMRLMGATIRDKFSNDVTHVIFKDGSFTTFEKAKLMRIHLVSVLWLDAVRRNNARVPEKNYPAFGNRVCDSNVSVLCSQIQKDYEDVIQDEKKRRHTMMTSKTSMSSYLSAKNLPSTPTRDQSPDLTSDDSDCGVIDGHTSKRPKDSDIFQASPALTDDLSLPGSNDSASLLNRLISRNKRKTIHVTSDMTLTPVTEKIIEATPETKKVLRNVVQESSTMSSLKISTDTDKTKSDLANSKKSSSSLSGGKENCSVTTIASTMSSLRLSESEKRSRSSSKPRTTPSESVSVNTDEKEVRKSESTKNQAVSSCESEDGAKKPIGGSPGSCQKVPKSVIGKDDSVKKINRRSPQKVGKVDTIKKTNRAEISSSESEEDDGEKKPTEGSPRCTEKPAKSVIGNVDSVKKTNRAEISWSESEDDGEKKPTDGSPRCTEKTAKSVIGKVDSVKKTNRQISSSESEDDAEKTKDRSPNKIRNQRKVRRTLIDSTESEFDLTESYEIVKKRDRRRHSRGSSKAGISDENLGLKTPIRTRKSVSVSSSVSETRSSNEKPESSELKSRKVFSPTLRKIMPTSEASNENPRSNFVPSPRRRTRSMSVTPNQKLEFPKPSTHKRNQRSPSSSSESDRRNPNLAKKLPPSVKKTKRLYNLNDLTGFSPLEDDKQREEYVKQKSQRSPDEVFLNPNTIQMNPLPPKRRSKRNSTSETSNLSSDESAIKEVKRKRKKKKKKEKTPPRRDSALDEQRELLDSLERSEGRRRSQRVILSRTQPSDSSLPFAPLYRRSTLDFVPVSQTQRKRTLKLDPKQTSSIVCTKMHREEVVNFQRIVNNLGRFLVEDSVTGKTTHLVVGEAKRTINMLRAIGRGCWILKHDWLLKSEEAGRWLSEEDYELTEFSPAVQVCRMQREAFGPLYSMDIFRDCGCIYVGKGTTPKPSDLKELISICKGKVTTVYRNAAICVGELLEKEGLTCVNEMWVLDSIYFNKLKSIKNYLLKPAGLDSPNF